MPLLKTLHGVQVVGYIASWRHLLSRSLSDAWPCRAIFHVVVIVITLIYSFF